MIKKFIATIFFLGLVSLLSQAQSLRIKAVGDIMMGSYTPSTLLPPDSGKVFVDSIAAYLDSADITFGNLEGVFVTEGIEPVKCRPESREAKRCYEFGMPATSAPRLKEMNFDLLSLDNNHVSDYGDPGIIYTKYLLDSLGIDYAAKKTPIVIDRDSIKIGVVAFGFSSVSYHVGDIRKAKEVVASLNEIADIIIVSFHGGAEGSSAQHTPNEVEKFYGENRGNVIAFAHAVIDAGADVVIGHGPHVSRGVELYKNKFITYSLGNFLTYGNVNITGIKGTGPILDLEIDRATGDFVEAQIVGTKQLRPGIAYYDSGNSAFEIIKELTLNDFPNSGLNFKDGKLLIKE